MTVIHGDQTENVFEFDTDAKYLGEVLESENLVDGESGEYGLFITTVDEEKAENRSTLPQIRHQFLTEMHLSLH